ncbi:unnamed protein product, partial [Ixodes persulcatus]
MPATKASTRDSFGRRSRSRKRRGVTRGRPRKSANPLPPPSPSLSSRASSSTGSTSPHASESIASTSNAEDVPVSAECLLTTFERKLDLLKCNEDDAKMADAPTEEPLYGYRLINVSAVRGLIDALLCPKCHGGELSLQERGTGADLLFVVGCSSCGDIVAAPHSPPIGKSRENELVMRLGVVGRDCRFSFTKLLNLFGGLNAPPPMHVKSYQKVAGKVHDAAMLAATQVMEEAARAVRKAQAMEGMSAESDLLGVCISYDGTWHKRGHTSQFGVGVAIELETGLVIDFAVQSMYCHGCQLGPKEGTEGFEEWADTHRKTCQKNYEGSSNAMEVQAAATIFSRSVERHKMQYVTVPVINHITAVLCDGDSKAFTHIAGLELYDKEIHKEDCVNNVAKRMYAGME